MINWIKNLFKKKEEQIDPISINNWSISRTQNKMVFKIPVGNLSKEEAEKYLKKLMNHYNTPMPISTNSPFTKIKKIERILNKIQPKDQN
jgi:predicted CopG family antitoxin